MNLISMTMVNAMKPVPYSMPVKNGSKNIQKTALKAQNTIRVSGLLNPCVNDSPSAEFSRSHANRTAV
jgi:hypothetical protein